MKNEYEFEPIKKRRKKRIIPYMIMIICILSIVYNGTMIVIYIIDNKKLEKQTEELSSKIVLIDEKEDQENKIYNNKKEIYEIDFKSLKEKNPDTVGFLKINGTDIESIVVKGQDNSFYLSHSFDKEKNAAGWIFADFANKFDGTDKNIIIYGHNMKNGTMFGTMKNILNDEWFINEENRKITFITEQEYNIYDVFSVYVIESEDYYRKTEFVDNEFKEFINVIKKRSKYDFQLDIYNSNQILTLSTCATNNKYRVVLHAVKEK